MYSFKEKIVVVTGAAQGLGAAMAKRFLEDGAAGVALLDMNSETLKATTTQLDPDGTRTLAMTCNVAESQSVEEAFKQVMDRFEKVDILINNAGITRDTLAHKMTVEQFDSVVQVSLNGAFYCVQQVINGMKEREWGRIISLSSLAARGNVGQSNYSAAKAGIIGLTKTLALELASKNITVNCIAPGLINTDIIKTVPDKQMEVFLKTIPMHRLGEPEEVANLAAYLASDEAAYISGQCIKIAGGLQ
ncbi:3-oxoacyl-ACP reductase FabG [Geosporobacter ferrireducens]|uniref:3-oxoacyl-ACP reductase FabG n=1 Tax=Geosporobacter ferrireducens TaxID=1424294 RepID=UPI00139EB085|nr:3-oxoacyl-ACP reductase FabG [Geosporobacter ferrireducens]MTI56582.1 3-oxoacyl-ACP reductase FabG [Geosporobacter ferrireducens]